MPHRGIHNTMNFDNCKALFNIWGHLGHISDISVDISDTCKIEERVAARVLELLASLCYDDTKNRSSYSTTRQLDMACGVRSL